MRIDKSQNYVCVLYILVTIYNLFCVFSGIIYNEYQTCKNYSGFLIGLGLNVNRE